MQQVGQLGRLFDELLAALITLAYSVSSLMMSDSNTFGSTTPE